jgi:two-component system cell cycle response regulator
MSARVLVVDDILPNVKLLEAKLTSEYYDVLTATNGKEALEKVAAQSPDLVLLDVMMPGMDGFEVCTRIKQNPALAHIPVVMVTALTDAEDKVRGLESGADDFLSKPINDTALMARVRSLVRLKMALDEWRVRENTANQLGVVEKQSNVMMESADSARVLVVEDKISSSARSRKRFSAIRIL